MNSNGIPVHYHKVTCGMVIQAFDEKIYFCVGENGYVLDLIPNHSLSSKNFDFVTEPNNPKMRYIPPMSHP